MVVERARGESQVTSGSLQSLCWGSSSTGGIVSAYFSGYFVATYGVRYLFYVVVQNRLGSWACNFEIYGYYLTLQIKLSGFSILHQ